MIRKTRKKKSKIKLFLASLLAVIVVGFIFKSIMIPENPHSFAKNGDGRSRNKPAPSFPIASETTVSIPADRLHSPNAILIRLTDHRILMQKKSEEKIYPASLTKMMTTIVAIENLPNLHEKIKLPGSMFHDLFEADATMAGFQPNEQVEAIDLLYGVLLPSGAESCIGLAGQIAGSEQGFVKMMNQKASELGMDHTHFENVTGLHDKNHYTTVKDLAVLLSYALQNDTFREIFTSPRHSTQATNKHPNGITFNSTLFEKLKDPSVTGGKILGGKTGYTDEAGLCLASLAEEAGKEYVMVTAGANGNHKTKQYNITDALTVYNSLGKK